MNLEIKVNKLPGHTELSEWLYFCYFLGFAMIRASLQGVECTSDQKSGQSS